MPNKQSKQERRDYRNDVCVVFQWNPKLLRVEKKKVTK